MGDVGVEAEAVVEAGDEVVGDARRRLLDRPALTADDVDVGGVAGEVVARDAVVDVGVAHEAELLERLERPVDRREGHRRPAALRHHVDDLLRRRMAERLDRVEDLLALWREPPAGGAEPGAEITHPSNVCRSPVGGEPRTYTGRVLDVFPDEDSRSATGPRRKSRRGRRFLVFVASLLALVLVAVGGFVVFLDQKVSNNIAQEDLLPEAAKSATLPDGTTVEVPQSSVGKNYLIIGTDARPGETASRSDVIVLAHVPEDRSTVQLIHFPRDLYVPIPGRRKDKINAAYAHGGAPLLVSTMQNLLGVKIDHVAKTDFEGFRTMTDAVGGVRVYAEEASGEGGSTVREGFNDLNGEQALAFVRERYQLSEGDISRGRRQQAFIKALMLKTISVEVLTNPITLTRFVDAATDNLVVDRDLSVATMRREAFALRGIRSGDVVFITAPFTGFGTAPDGGSIEILDEAGIAALGTALRTDEMESYADVSVIP